ncbi:MAG: M20/M25/M40 family metallo-hydrolase [Bryobacteraceae bacterium]
MSRHLPLTPAIRANSLIGALVLSAMVMPAADVRSWREAHERQIVAEFTELLAIPNIASDRVNIRRNAEFIRKMLERRGAKTRLLEAAGAPPVVYGEIAAPQSRRTLVFYAHYDGQPVDPKEWDGAPFRPVLRDGVREVSMPAAGGRFNPEWRMYARSASDDKGTIVAMMAALDAMRAAGRAPAVNLKFFFEGEEEAGSPHLETIVRTHRDLLGGDVWLICDGPVHQTRRQQLYFGARGVTGVDLTVYGPRRELHSGHYGNWAPNPAMSLAQLLASMKDGDGRITIAGFYDSVEPLSGTERRALAEAPDNDDELRSELWLGGTEGRGRKLVDSIMLPSLNVRGVASGAVGEQARNVIPATATASLDIRLVKGLSHQKAFGLLLAHVRKQGWHVVEGEPDAATRLRYPRVIRVQKKGGYNAVRTPMDLPAAKQVIETVKAVRGSVALLPTLGGSVPLYVFEEQLRAPMVGLPIANHDNSQHGSNENLRLQNLWDGIEVMAALMGGQ